MSSLVIVRVRIVSSASAGKASMVLVAMTLANAMILVDQTAVPIALPDILTGPRTMGGAAAIAGALGPTIGRRADLRAAVRVQRSIIDLM